MKKLTLFSLILFNSFMLMAQSPVIDSLENELKQHTEVDTTRINILNALAYKLQSTDSERAMEYANEALANANKIDDAPLKIGALRMLGIVYSRKGDFQQSLKYFQKALDIAVENDIKEGLLRCYLNIGIVYSNLGDFSMAIEHYQKALDISEETKDNNGRMLCYNSIGAYYNSQGNYPKATEYFQKSYVLAEEFGQKRDMATSLNNLANIEYIQENYSKSLEYLHQSLKIDEEIGNTGGVATELYNIGFILKNQKKYSEAFGYYKKSLELRRQVGDKPGVVYSLTGLSSLSRIEGNYKESLDYLEEGLRIAEEMGDNIQICMVKRGIGKVYLEKQMPKKALGYVLESLEIAKTLGMTDEKKDVNELLSEIYAEMGSYKKAYEFHKAYKELNDSLFNKESVKKIANLTRQYEFDKEKQALEAEQQKKEAVYKHKMKEQKTISYAAIIGFILMVVIVLLVFRGLRIKRESHRQLEKQKKKIEEDNKTLKKLNTTKDKFFSIIAHDLRSPLGTLHNMGEILLLKQGQVDENYRQRVTESLVESTKTTFNLLDNLLKWARANLGQMNFKPQKIKVNDIINENVDIYRTSLEAKNIGLVNSIKHGIYIYGDRDMVNTIIRNLLSNAIKFTPENGTIEILSKKTAPDKIEIGVSDTGMGMDAGAISKLFRDDTNYTTYGTNKEKGSGLGLKLCKEFVEKNKGEIKIESEPGEGTIFWVVFQLEESEGEVDVNVNTSIKKVNRDKVLPVLTDEEKGLITKGLYALRNTRIYEISKLRKILAETESDKNENIERWKEAVERAVQNEDVKAYKELIGSGD